MLKQWDTWFKKLGTGLVDPGLPFSGAVNKVKPDGTSAKGPVGQRATGYTIIDAASLDKATKVAKGCPLLKSGGSISVYSEQGSGTTFRIYFPLVVRDPEQPATPAVAEEPEALRGHETILLVEDQESVRRFAALALEAKGYQVLQATNGVEALKVLGTSTVALVITDVIMPDMGGVALASYLRQLAPSLPILFISGHAESTLPRREGAPEEATLQKPFSPFELAKKVRELLSERG